MKVRPLLIALFFAGWTLIPIGGLLLLVASFEILTGSWPHGPKAPDWARPAFFAGLALLVSGLIAKTGGFGLGVADWATRKRPSVWILIDLGVLALLLALYTLLYLAIWMQGR